MTDSRPVDRHEFRMTMSLFATGVTILTTSINDTDWLGMTANAVTSVSLDPLLILVCVDKHSQLIEPLANGGGFTISILSAEQESLSTYFAGMWGEGRPAPDFAVEDSVGGPRIADCIAAISCEAYEVLEGGDHLIVLGKVTSLYRQDKPQPPLIFFAGLYRELGSLA